MTAKPKRNFLKSSLENASFNILCQIAFRVVTFLLNAFVLRYVTQDVLGVMNVRLLLLESTILFLSREAFRRACLSKTTDHYWPQIINLIWLTVPICLFCSVVFGYVWLHVLAQPDTSVTNHYSLGVWAIAISCLVEMCSEPLYLVAQAFLFVRLKVVIDTIYIAVRSLIFTPLVVWSPENAVVAFSVAQVLSGLVASVCYYVYFYYYISKREEDQGLLKKDKPVSPGSPVHDDFPFHSLKDFLPRRLNDKASISMPLAALTWSFFKQGILKQILTEGERYVMTVFSVLSFAEQGVYDIVNNLGSMAARFIFRPIEESGYFYFSQMVKREATMAEQNPKEMAEASQVLYYLLRGITVLGLCILMFGFSYSDLLLYLYGGQKLVSGPGPVLLRTHCFCVLLLAVNGITECYAFAAMSRKQLDSYNYIMVLLSVMFLAVSWGLTKLLGGVGFILANCCNMLARIAHSVHFIHTQFQGTPYKPLRGLMPGPLLLTALLVGGIFTAVSEAHVYPRSKISHLLLGAICFLIVVATCLYEEKKLVQFAVSKWKERRKEK